MPLFVFKRGSKVLKAVGFAGICFLAVVLLWTNRMSKEEDLFEYEQQADDQMQVPLLKLRELGEQLASSYRGSMDMGMPGSKNELRAVNWARVQVSCTPRYTGASRSAKVVLVTGAGGFVGMHAAMQLRKRGDGVVGLDNFNDYYPVSLKRSRQVQAEAAGVYTVDGDINSEQLLQQLFDKCKFTHVLHLAAQAGVRYATKNPYSYVHANLAGQVKLLEVIKGQQPMPALVYASSSSVYGLNSKQPFSEEDRVDVPASLYAATKRADELMAHVYYNIYGMSVTGLRFFTVYGPWGRPDMAAYKFAVNIMHGEPIRIFQGPEKQELKRDFTFIGDITAGVLGALDAITASGKATAQYKLYNLGNTSPHTVTELVELLEKHLGRQAVRNYVPLPPTGDVLATFADVQHAREDFGYAPSTSLDAGVQQFTEWFKEFYGSAVLDGRTVPQDWAYNPM